MNCDVPEKRYRRFKKKNQKLTLTLHDANKIVEIH